MSEHAHAPIGTAEELRSLRGHLRRLEAEARYLAGGPGQGGVVSSIAFVEGKIAALERAMPKIDPTPACVDSPGSRTTAALAALAATEEEIRAAHAQSEAVKATWEPFWASRHATHFLKAQQEVLDAITAELPTLLTLVTAADAFVAAYTAYHDPWVLESSREGLTAERTMADAIAAYQAARGRQTCEEGS